MLLRFILYYIINIGLGIINNITLATEELPTQQQQTEEEELNNESNTEGYQPLYTNSYDLCSDIIADIETIKDKAHNANNLWDMALMWYDLQYGTILQLLDLKLGLLQHFLERGK
jgi:hypothetical protein